MFWWENDPKEKYWVEIRHIEGLGTYLSSPLAKANGARDLWYDLVGMVNVGDVILHWNVREGRLVGASRVKAKPEKRLAKGEWRVDLEGFQPFEHPVDRAELLTHADAFYDLRDKLAAKHSPPLGLPFQFTTDRSNFRFMSNYFAKMPAAGVDILLGNGQGKKAVGDLATGSSDLETSNGKVPTTAFLNPFKAKADTEYLTKIVAKSQVRSRLHETLVNNCAQWLFTQGFDPARNAAIDLGLIDGSLIIEAKVVKSWPDAVRQAVGQLYEYRYFKVADPQAALIFLSDQPVPDEWITYLEKDRGIGAMWPKGKTGFEMSKLAAKLLG